MLISRTIHSAILAIGVDKNLFVIFRRVFTVSTNYPPCIEMEKVKVAPSCGRATLVNIREWLLLEKSCNNNKKSHVHNASNAIHGPTFLKVNFPTKQNYFCMHRGINFYSNSSGIANK